MRRRPATETKTNHERWLVSYADFITLLFAFFVVMYSVSQVSESKYRVLSDTLGATFQQPSFRQQQPPQAAESGLATLGQLETKLTDALQGMLTSGALTMWGNEQWVEIEVNANVLFQSGSAEPSREAKRIFSDVADVLAPYENAIAISGHTDDLPINNERFDSNWELSSARASAVVKLLAYNGVDPTRLSAVGYGEYQPIADNQTAQGRAQNRRVVLRVARSKAEAPRTGAAEIVGSERQSSSSAVAEQTQGSLSQEPVPESIQESEQRLEEAPLKPIRLPDGGLLFTNEPRGRGEG